MVDFESHNFNGDSESANFNTTAIDEFELIEGVVDSEAVAKAAESKEGIGCDGSFDELVCLRQKVKQHSLLLKRKAALRDAIDSENFHELRGEDTFVKEIGSSKRLCRRDGVSAVEKVNACPCLLYKADKISEALFKICWSSWWEWDVGSSLLYWRWGEELELVRDGMFPFISSALPKNLKKGRSLQRN